MEWIVSYDVLTWRVADGTSTAIPWPLVAVQRGQWGYHLTFNKRGEHVIASRSFASPEDRGAFESVAERAGVLRA